MSLENQPEKNKNIPKDFVICPAPSDIFEGKTSTIKDSGSEGSDNSDKLNPESFVFSSESGDEDRVSWEKTSLMVMRSMKKLEKEMGEPDFNKEESKNAIEEMEKEVNDLKQLLESRRAARAEELAAKASELKAETEEETAEIEMELEWLSESFHRQNKKEMIRIDDELADWKRMIDKEQDSERKERLKVRCASLEANENAYLVQLRERYDQKRTELKEKRDALQATALQKLKEFKQRQTKELAMMGSMVKMHLQQIAQLKKADFSISLLSKQGGPGQV